jgi:hypothetical protein
MKFILGLILLVLFAVPSKAQTDTTDGNYLLGSSRLSLQQMDSGPAETPVEAWRNGVCSGLVMGILYASPSVCHDANVTLGQGIRVVDKYLRDHPERLNLGGPRLVDEALSAAFPCKKP